MILDDQPPPPAAPAQDPSPPLDSPASAPHFPKEPPPRSDPSASVDGPEETAPTDVPTEAPPACDLSPSGAKPSPTLELNPSEASVRPPSEAPLDKKPIETAPPRPQDVVDAGSWSAVDDLPGRIEQFSISAPSSAPLPDSTPPQEPLVDDPQTSAPPQKDAEEEWILKEIAWPPLPPPPSAETEAETGEGTGPELASGPTIRIITQNRNGPCSLIALCNILILRGDILINPPHRPSVSYSYLSSLVGDYLLRLLSSSSSDDPDRALSAALEILPSTRYGLNLNPRFASIDGFRPTTTSATTSPSHGAEGSVTGELALFALSKVPLLHGWVVDPQDEETWEVLVGEAGDYDHAVEMVVEGEVVSGGLDESGERTEEEVLALVAKRSLWTPADEKKVRTAHIISKFLAGSRTQLTYHGLFLLSSHLPPSSLSALFRNSHLSVIYRRPLLPPSARPGPELFTLVTDSSFAGEPSIVWESLEDVEGGASEFFDGALGKSEIRGGDWVGRGGEGERRRRERRERERWEVELQAGGGQEEGEGERRGPATVEDHDFRLAQQLQLEEDEHEERQERRERAEEEERFARLTREDRERREDRIAHEHEREARRGREGGHREQDPERRKESTGRERGEERGRDERRKSSSEKAKGDKCLVM